ncbi:hypothetical protein J1N35_022713 [Gossypium stocksii]|uniref:Uncharacterized protein n=1 Tax=Gossypium stocksii TaxID=47602 RepID=A0A9D3VI97_9ROSI|nr:hypothetical protein J1N35_022713 [Gossypium stocksii]
MQLNTEIVGYSEARERELPLVQEVKSKAKELHEMIASLNSNQISLKTSFWNLKEKIKQMDEKAYGKCHDYHVEKTATIEVYSKALKKMSKHFTFMQAIHEHVNSAKSVENECKGLKAKLSDGVVLDKSLEAKLIERQGKGSRTIGRTQKERDLKFEESTKHLNRVKSEVLFKRCDLEARQKKVEDVVAEVDSITFKSSMVRESGAAKVQKLISKCEEIVKQFQQYSSSCQWTGMEQRQHLIE